MVPKRQRVAANHPAGQQRIGGHRGGDVGGAGGHPSTVAAPGAVGHPLPPHSRHRPATLGDVVRHADLVVAQVHGSRGGVRRVEGLDVLHGEGLSSGTSGAASATTGAVGAPVAHPWGAREARGPARALVSTTASIPPAAVVGVAPANRAGTTIHLLLSRRMELAAILGGGRSKA